ncbi:MAG: nucleotidyltransferase family protein [Acidobacteriota bacterium]
MAIEREILAKRDEILRLASQHGATRVRVFGSVARGDSGPDSDLDLLVDTRPQTSAWFPASLILDLEDLLGRKVDVVTERALHRLLREQILAEAVPL